MANQDFRQVSGVKLTRSQWNEIIAFAPPEVYLKKLQDVQDYKATDGRFTTRGGRR